MHKVPQQELEQRMARFRRLMDQYDEDWEIVYIFTRVGQYYFTGTMQDGVLIVPRDTEATYWVRISYERAMDESNFSNIKVMRSYRDAAASFTAIPKTAYIEKDFLPMSLWERFSKYFETEKVKAVGAVISQLRWRKSAYELEQMRAAGTIHQRLLEQEVPKLLREGMSENGLTGEIYSLFVREGHQGIARFAMFDTQIVVGQIAIGANALYPTHFDGPGGNRAVSPAAPYTGNPNRKIKPGDLIFVDTPVMVNGYHTDKTMIYSFGENPKAEVMREHQACVAIKDRIVEQMKPGVLPEDIYNNVMGELSPEFLKNFMGYADRQVKFLGHGIGLFIDEMPVIADRFKMPLEENMCFALEPKKGIAGVGMVGIEETYVVTPNGGECITGDHAGLMVI